MKCSYLLRPLVLMTLLAALAADHTVALALDQNEKLAIFFRATQTGDMERAAALLKENPDLARAKNNNGATALHGAVYGQIAMVQWLLQQGADPNVADARGMTPLHTAVSDGRTKPEIVGALIAAAADVNLLSGKVYRPLHLAVGARNKAVAQLLVQHGARDDATPLFDAIARGDQPRVEELIRASPTLVYRSAPLAPVKSGKDISQDLTQDITMHHPSNNSISPLHAAVFWGDAAIVSLLVEGKAALEVHDQHGQTPLHEAVNLNDLAMAKLLLDKGARVNAQAFAWSFMRARESGMTPLHFAAQQGEVKMVTLLIEHGADINAQTTFKRTPLDWAARFNNVPVASLLCARGSAYGESNKGGSVSLDHALNGRHEELARVLIEGGADANAKDSMGEVPLHKAAQSGLPKIVKLLLEIGKRRGCECPRPPGPDSTAPGRL